MEQEISMRIRVNVNSLKNAMGTVFLLAAAFFVCSTFISMRSVFADPIAQTNVVQTSGRISPRSNATTRANVSRATVARTNNTASRTTVSRGTGTRSVSSRSITPTRSGNVSTRGVTSRSNAQNRTTTSNRAVRARTAATPSRVGATGTVMAGSRASTSTSYSYLSSKLYTGSYANIIDSSTGLISAEAYSNCMESYYACMDEICTARSDTKGRCSCAGRVNNFLDAEEQLETANEELIKLSGQLSLLIATKGKGKDLSSAFSLTEAEQVMNCVSWQETIDKYGKSSDEAINWCTIHNIYSSNGGEVSSCDQPSYCTNNSFGFKITDLNDIKGSSSDILAQLKAWADAKDLAKQYESDDVNNLASVYTNISGIVKNISASADNAEDVSVDALANKWGYKLFEYAHNNVCGRVLDSCFNGIYEACGTPVSVKDSDGKTHKKCANGATSNCPFNYNSYISVTTDESNLGDVVLNERGSSTADTSASCFGYTTTATTTTGTRTTSTTSSDPYYTLRGPVADARRSIMQKYLLDANSACDVYGEALKKTAQNINYQKIAAQQALQQKRLEFKQQADATALAEATAAIDNFNECISEIWDCYENYEEEEKWTTARIKAYCSQASQVPHCYETMICSPLQTQLTAVTDLPDDTSCTFSTDYTENTCRNVVTISEILYGTGATTTVDILSALGGKASVSNQNSAAIREACLQQALKSGDSECNASNQTCLRGWKKGALASDTSETYSIKYYRSEDGSNPYDVTSTVVSPATYTVSSSAQTITPYTGIVSGGSYRQTGFCVFSSASLIGNIDNALNCGTSTVTIPANTTGTLYVVEYGEWL